MLTSTHHTTATDPLGPNTGFQVHPTLQTERLILRPLVFTDFDAYVEFWQTDEVTRYISGSALPREQIWRRLIGTVGHWQLLGFGFFAIEDKASGKLIGEAGFQEMHRDLVPSIEGTLETGWGVLPEFHGKGYAKEAVGVAMDWAAQAHPTLDFTCIISPENLPSIALAIKLGFDEKTLSSYAGKPTLIFKKTRAR